MPNPYQLASCSAAHLPGKPAVCSYGLDMGHIKTIITDPCRPGQTWMHPDLKAHLDLQRAQDHSSMSQKRSIGSVRSITFGISEVQAFVSSDEIVHERIHLGFLKAVEPFPTLEGPLVEYTKIESYVQKQPRQNYVGALTCFLALQARSFASFSGGILSKACQGIRPCS